MTFVKKHRVVLMSLAILIVAFSIRAPRAVEGLPYLHHWDEPRIGSVALEMLKTGDFNPHFFNYPSLLTYLNLLVDIPHYLYLVGQPEDAAAFVSSPADIKTYHTTGWRWTISHPSFYKWNRLLTCLFGAGTAVVVFLLGLRIFRWTWVALVPAVLISVLPFHVSQSSYITTDVPTGFFVVCTTLFSLYYFQEGRLKCLVWGLIFCGLAAGTKYNSVFIVVPIIFAVGYRYYVDRKDMSHYHWILVPTVPLAVFMLTNPYAFLDLGAFLHDVGYEVRHYRVLGHYGFTTNPGWELFWYQMLLYREELGTTVAIIIVLGLGAVIVRRDLAFIFIYPIVLIASMVQMRADFHRNFAQLYPYWGLFLAAGVLYLQVLLRALEKRLGVKSRGVLVVLLWVVVGTALMRMVTESVVESYSIAMEKETRMLGIELVNGVENVQAVVLAKELRFHEEDLRKLKIPRQIESLSSIHRIAGLLPGTLFVVPAHLSIFAPEYNQLEEDRNRVIVGRHSQYLGRIRKETVCAEIGENFTYLDAHCDRPGPGLVVYLPEPKPSQSSRVFNAGSGTVFSEGNWQAAVSMGQDIILSRFVLSRGIYSISFDCRYSEETSPPIEITVVVEGADGAVIKENRAQYEQRGIDWRRGFFHRYSTDVLIKKAGEHTVKIWLDYAITEPAEPSDGTLYINNIEVRRQ